MLCFGFFSVIEIQRELHLDSSLCIPFSLFGIRLIIVHDKKGRCIRQLMKTEKESHYKYISNSNGINEFRIIVQPFLRTIAIPLYASSLRNQQFKCSFEYLKLFQSSGFDNCIQE